MSTITIPLGSKVHVVWLGGKTASYIFRGTDSEGPIFETPGGKRQLSALDRPYLSLTIEPPRSP